MPRKSRLIFVNCRDVPGGHHRQHHQRRRHHHHHDTNNNQSESKNRAKRTGLGRTDGGRRRRPTKSPSDASTRPFAPSPKNTELSVCLFFLFVEADKVAGHRRRLRLCLCVVRGAPEPERAPSRLCSIRRSVTKHSYESKKKKCAQSKQT